jgi:hypothetical protein
MMIRRHAAPSPALATTVAVPVASAAACLAGAVRWQAGWTGIMGNQHLKHVDVKQADGVDDPQRVRAEQQRWLNHEQYSGYSDSYLRKGMTYAPQYEYLNSSHLTRANKVLAEICDVVFRVYGEAADALEEAELNPLHPRFNELVATAKAKRGELEAEIDRRYPDAHPTVKTMYDAMLVRRWQTLEDWTELVQRKRAQALDRLSPEWIDELEKQRGVAADYLARLKHIGTAMEANPVAFLEGSGFTEKELVMIERRMRFFRKTAIFASNTDRGDTNPH